MSLSLFYPQTLKYYDGARRERSASICQTYDDPYAYFFNDVQPFTYDFTNAVSESTADERVIVSYANGVTMSLKTWLSNETDDTLYVSYRYTVYDKEGHDVTSQLNEPVYGSEQSGWYLGNMQLDKSVYPNKSSVKIYRTPLVQYNDATEAYYSQMTLVHLIPTPSPYDPPALNGSVNVQNFSTYYNTIRTEYITDDVHYKNLMDIIQNNGDDTPITPQKPSEDTSEPGGGDDAYPDYNPFSDPVDFPGLPTGGSAIASGFIRVYSPTAGQLQSLAGKLWGNDFVNTIHKIMNDPMEAMISLHSVPFQIVGGANANIEVGNFDTEVSAKTVTTQYYTLDCGNISLPEHWASALDYSPYTTVDIFIPFVGVRSLQIDDVMNRVLNLKYNIDILTGSAVAMLKCGDSVLYTYNTQVHTEIPYTMSSYGRLVQSIIGIAGTAIGATAGGAGAIIGGSIGGALGTAMTKHSDVSRGGALGGAVGVMGDFTPYLIIHRPIQSLASDFASKKGYPSNIGATLSSLSGYTVVDKIHLTGIDCTDTERDEIRALLKDGVII